MCKGGSERVSVWERVESEGHGGMGQDSEKKKTGEGRECDEWMLINLLAAVMNCGGGGGGSCGCG